MKGKWRCSQRYLGPRELGTAMAWVAMKISKRTGEILEDLLSAGHEGQVFKKVLGVEEGAELRLAVGGRDFPEALADQVFRGYVFVKGLVVAAQVLGEGVCHDLVHIDADALHGAPGGQWTVDSCQFRFRTLKDIGKWRPAQCGPHSEKG